jgi:hypothetical protein
MRSSNKIERGLTVTAVGLSALMLGTGVVAYRASSTDSPAASSRSPKPAVAKPVSDWCPDAWRAPASGAADWCREHGWTVTSFITVTPGHQPRYVDLPDCTYEDGSGEVGPPCVWWAHKRGNHVGTSLWWDRHNHPHLMRGFH